MGRFMGSMELFMTLLSVAVITVRRGLIMKGTMTYVDLITFSLYITTFINPVRETGQLCRTVFQRVCRSRPFY